MYANKWLRLFHLFTDAHILSTGRVKKKNCQAEKNVARYRCLITIFCVVWLLFHFITQCSGCTRMAVDERCSCFMASCKYVWLPFNIFLRVEQMRNFRTTYFFFLKFYISSCVYFLVKYK